MSRVPKKIALQPLMAGASVCPGGVLEDEAEDINHIADDSISDDGLEGVPLAGNWSASLSSMSSSGSESIRADGEYSPCSSGAESASCNKGH